MLCFAFCLRQPGPLQVAAPWTKASLGRRSDVRPPLVRKTDSRSELRPRWPVKTNDEPNVFSLEQQLAGERANL